MKGKVLNIGAVVLGFIFSVQSSYAMGLPQILQIQKLTQIDAEEISRDEESRIRFSDVDDNPPKVVPSQQTMSSMLANNTENDGYLVDFYYLRMGERFGMHRDTDDWEDNRSREDRGQPDVSRDYEEIDCGHAGCAYPDSSQNSSKKRCEMRDGLYLNGACYIKEEDEDESARDGCKNRGDEHSRGTCPIDYGEYEETQSQMEDDDDSIA